jgi:hypothetical protein
MIVLLLRHRVLPFSPPLAFDLISKNRIACIHCQWMNKSYVIQEYLEGIKFLALINLYPSDVLTENSARIYMIV